MNARFYEPSTGRFISQDSYSGNAYDPWTQHLYSYCGNNPTNFVDPTGHFAIPFFLGLIEAVVAVLGGGAAASTGSTDAGRALAKSTSKMVDDASENLRETRKSFWGMAGLAFGMLTYDVFGGDGTIAADPPAGTSTQSQSKPKEQAQDKPITDTATDTKKYPKVPNYAYRALSSDDVANLEMTGMILPGNLNGTATLTEHIAYGSQPSTHNNTPWISSTRRADIALGKYNSGHGVAMIDLNKVPSFSIDAWLFPFDVNTVTGRRAENFSFADMEVLTFGPIPQEAIVGYLY